MGLERLIEFSTMSNGSTLVFVHPISPAGQTDRLARLGHAGILLAGGTRHAASVLALLRSGLFDELPDLKVVVPMIGAAPHRG